MLKSLLRILRLSPRCPCERNVLHAEARATIRAMRAQLNNGHRKQYHPGQSKEDGHVA